MSSTTSTSRPCDLAAQVLEDAHLAARLGRVAVGGDLEEIDLDRQVELAHQVGDEDEGAAQQADHHQLVGAGVECSEISRASASTRAAMAFAEIISSIT